MALQRNGRAAFINPLRQLGGASSFQIGERNKGNLRNYFANDVIDAKAAIPNGYQVGTAWVLPRTSGGMSSYVLSNPTLSPTASLTPARNLQLSGSIALTLSNAQLDQIVSLIASALLTLTNNNASLASAAAMQASATFALAVNNALCGAIFSVTTNGVLQLNPNALLTALAQLEVDYVPGSGGAYATSAELQAAKDELLLQIAKTLTKKQFIALKD